MAILRASLALLVVAAALAGCFSPNRPPCAFLCVDDGICPAGYSCQSDGLCHRDDGQGVCVIPPQVDAGSDDTSGADGAAADGP